jgi:DNA mismatch repair protein MutL
MRVSGYIGMPQLSHANRGKITLFVNGRPVSDVRLTSAVVQAYHTLMMVGRYPVAVVMVRVPPGDVDVNAHPAKTEVRFRDANAVFGAVQRAVRKTLLLHLPVPEAPSAVFWDARAGDSGLGTGDLGLGARDWSRESTPVPNSQPPASSAQSPTLSHQQSSLAGSDTWERVGIQRSSQASPAIGFQPHMMPQQPATRSNLPALRILGQLAETYIIAEGPEGLYLIDQHAAHERILFERMLAQAELGEVSAQALLDPVPAQIPPGSAHLLEENLPVLRDLGFAIEAFGGNTFLIRAVPAMLIQDDVIAALREIVADLETGAAPMRKDLEARVLRRVCKRMAIKAGRVLPLAEMQALVRDLEACESPRTCPHGRPTMIQISTGALEKQFGRLG